MDTTSQILPSGPRSTLPGPRDHRITSEELRRQPSPYRLPNRANSRAEWCWLIVGHPSFVEAGALRSWLILVALRMVFVVAATFGLDELLPLGTPPLLVGCGGAVGVLFGSIAAFAPLTRLGFVVLLAALSGTYLLLQGLLPNLPLISSTSAFFLFGVFEHLSMVGTSFLLGAALSWAFWRSRAVLSLEFLLLGLVSLGVLSGHRNLRLDLPRFVNNLAWFFGVEHLTMLVALGGGTLVLLLLYLFVGSLPSRPTAEAKDRIIATRFRADLIGGVAMVGLCALALFVISREVYQYYYAASLSKVANGVGQESKEGLSPLGFHSALGSTNQPAALVRLEGDYPKNPFTPMLYMREAALSDLQGNELVIAPKQFDREVSGNRPEEPFQGVEDTALMYRAPVVQSIYLLTDHKLAFALDYPISIARLKNPNPARFRVAYRAYSVAPSFELKDLRFEEVGDPRWTAAERELYLKPHQDPRYQDLANRITQGILSPLEKAFAITQYLSAHTTYTLTPNHQVADGADPVAPYVFGDWRGYCVHFAHAMVYLFRSLGIPSRIGTGYLTDLSQARDGHILLRMSDRHAWAEIYVTDRGWIPFDIQPASVESHAETQVDTKLLEELMSMLDPGEEVLPKDIAKEELEPSRPSMFPHLSPLMSLACALLLLSTLVTWKWYLYFGFTLTRDPRTRLRRSFRSVVARLSDLGFRRRFGETWEEYRARIRYTTGLTLLTLTDLLNMAHYCVEANSLLAVHDIDERRDHDVEVLQTLPWWRKMQAVLNLASLIGGSRGR